MTITVSNTEADDLPEWQRLYRAYADFYQVPMDDEILDTVWSWIFDEQQAFFGLIAKTDNGDCIGLMHFREMHSPIRGAMVGFLDDLYVDPEHRGSGVVDALYAELSKIARHKGWPFVRWITAEDNYRGRGAYDRIAQKTAWLTYQMPAT
jgi:ribosomal protein S18 acetylase RimI-like enzyme